MKEQTLIEMRNTVAQLNQSMGMLYQEIMRLNERVHQIGGVLIELPGHDEAVKKFAQQIQEANEKAKASKDAIDASGETQPNGKDKTQDATNASSEKSKLDLDL